MGLVDDRKLGYPPGEGTVSGVDDTTQDRFLDEVMETYDPAFPVVISEATQVALEGLSRREYIAIKMMQGMVSDEDMGFNRMAAFAIEATNALLKALDDDS